MNGLVPIHLPFTPTLLHPCINSLQSPTSRSLLVLDSPFFLIKDHRLSSSSSSPSFFFFFFCFLPLPLLRFRGCHFITIWDTEGEKAVCAWLTMRPFVDLILYLRPSDSACPIRDYFAFLAFCAAKTKKIYDM